MLLFRGPVYAGGLWLSSLFKTESVRRTRLKTRCSSYVTESSFDESCVDSRHLADSSVPRPATRLAVTPSV